MSSYHNSSSKIGDFSIFIIIIIIIIKTSVHILCEYKALASLRHKYLGSFFLDPEDIRVLGVGAIWNFVKETGLL